MEPYTKIPKTLIVSRDLTKKIEIFKNIDIANNFTEIKEIKESQLTNYGVVF